MSVPTDWKEEYDAVKDDRDGLSRERDALKVQCDALTQQIAGLMNVIDRLRTRLLQLEQLARKANEE